MFHVVGPERFSTHRRKSEKINYERNFLIIFLSIHFQDLQFQKIIFQDDYENFSLLEFKWTRLWISQFHLNTYLNVGNKVLKYGLTQSWWSASDWEFPVFMPSQTNQLFIVTIRWMKIWEMASILQSGPRDIVFTYKWSATANKFGMKHDFRQERFGEDLGFAFFCIKPNLDLSLLPSIKSCESLNITTEQFNNYKIVPCQHFFVTCHECVNQRHPFSRFMERRTTTFLNKFYHFIIAASSLITRVRSQTHMDTLVVLPPTAHTRTNLKKEDVSAFQEKPCPCPCPVIWTHDWFRQKLLRLREARP